MTTTLKREAVLKIESAVGDAHSLAILLQWVENARQLIGQFERLAEHDKEFDALCKRSEIPVYMACFESEHSDALTRLISIQCQFLNTAQDAAGGSAA